jgi:hypothetical protein
VADDSARFGKFADQPSVDTLFHALGVSVMTVKSNGSTVTGKTAVSAATIGTNSVNLSLNNTYFQAADVTITVNYMLDFTDNYSNAARMDSVLKDVQDISALVAVVGSLVTNDAMDFNTDGYAEGEGVYVYQASSGTAQFKLSTTTARFNPSFKINSWGSAALPEIVIVDNQEQIRGYDYSAVVDGANNSLIIHFNKTFRGSGYRSILIAQKASLAVTLSEFRAVAGNGVDSVLWTTESEIDNLGYYLLKRVKPNVENMNSIQGVIDTAWVRVNKKLIPGAKGGRSSLTKQYQYIDSYVKAGVTYQYMLVAVDYNGNEERFGPVEVVSEGPKETALFGNYPNPFNPSTTIRFDLAEKTKLSLKVYNMKGQEMMVLVDDKVPLEPGKYKIYWDAKTKDGKELQSGHYLYVFKTPKYRKIKKMTLLK